MISVRALMQCSNSKLLLQVELYQDHLTKITEPVGGRPSLFPATATDTAEYVHSIQAVIGNGIRDSVSML